jgi:hypothetical protein
MRTRHESPVVYKRRRRSRIISADSSQEEVADAQPPCRSPVPREAEKGVQQEAEDDSEQSVPGTHTRTLPHAHSGASRRHRIVRRSTAALPDEPLKIEARLFLEDLRRELSFERYRTLQVRASLCACLM